MDIKGIINSFPGKNILVVGDIILDHYIWGRVERISPEAPVPVVEVEAEGYRLGGAGNVAHNITSLGARAAIAGIAGNDHRADILVSLLKERNIETVGICLDNRQTTEKTRVIAHSQQVVRFDRENKAPIDKHAFKAIIDYIADNISAFDAIIISDYKKGVVSASLTAFIVDIAGKRDLFVSVDPKVGHFHYYKETSLITPNKKEASEGAAIEIKDKDTLQRAGQRLLERLHCGAVLITLGEDGMSLFEKDMVHHIPTVARHVFDVTGAGDTVIAVATLSYACGAALFDSAVIANHAAGIVVAEAGTAVTTRDELLASFKE